MSENHSFNILFAQKYGIEEAIVFDNIYHWCLHNKTKNINCNKDSEGNIRYWTFNSCKNFADYFIYINPSKIRKVLIHLSELKFILIDNFNKVKYDQTKWYTVTEAGEKAFLECCTTVVTSLYSEKSILRNEKCQFDEMENGSEQNEEPIPTSNSTSITDANTTSNFSAPSSSDLPPVSETTSTQVAELMSRIAELESTVKEQVEELKDKDILINENNKVIEKMSKNKTGKTSSLSKFSNKDYEECLKIINDNKVKLLKDGKDIDSTTYALPHMKKLLKHQFEYYGVEDTKKGLINSLHFSWLVDTSRYSMNALFSDKVFPKLIAGEFGNLKQSNSNTKKSGGINYTGQSYEGEVF